MKETVYHKLVRDRIPQIIREQGQECETRTLSQDEYLLMLDAKLQEEMQEYLEKHDPEEMADLLEVCYALMAAHGHSPAEIESIRLEKQQKRGGFYQRILLEKVKEHI